MNSDRFLLDGAAMSRRLSLPWLGLLKVMNLESGISPSARNASGAYGEIQIRNLPGAGWTEGPDAFLSLRDHEQLPYVENFLRGKARHNLHSTGRIHQALYVPATLDLPQLFPDSPSTVLASRDGSRLPQGISSGLRAALISAYNANPGFDRRAKGYTTVQDLEDTDDAAAARPRSPYLQDEERLRTLLPSLFVTPRSAIATALGVAAVATAGFLGYQALTRRAA